MQEASPSDLAYEECDEDTEDYSEPTADGASGPSHTAPEL